MSELNPWPRMNYLGISYEDQPRARRSPGLRGIVVGVDGSEQSVEALRWAAHHAMRLGAQLHVVAAWDAPTSIYLTPMATEHDYERKAEQALQTSVAAAFGTEAPVSLTAHVIADHPGKALVEAADEADMLVIGSHGRGLTHHLHGRVPGLHLGSVATYCVHNSPCAVVVIGATAFANKLAGTGLAVTTSP